DHAARRIADDLAVVLRSLGDRRCDSVAAVSPRHVTAADADHCRSDDVLSALHVHRLSADLCDHARRPSERDAPDGNAVIPARHLGRCARRRRGDFDRDGAVPAGRDHVQLLRPAAPRVATGRPRQMSTTVAAPSPQAGESVGMSYLETPSPKFVTIYLPLIVFLFVLLFPFYWMGITSVKPDHELLSRTGNPFW